MPRSGRPIPPTPLVLPLIRKCEVLFPRCRGVDVGFRRLPLYYYVSMSVLLALVTAGYFYDTFAYEICFYGIYFYGIYLYGIYVLLQST
jgi:hypothetical protein